MIAAAGVSSGIGAVNPLKYRGYYYDADLGMYYLQSRYYDPVVRRFINADDIDELDDSLNTLSLNLFAYCANNPVNSVDYDGRAVANVIGGLVGGVAGAALGYIILKKLKITGWKKWAIISAATVGGAALGAILAPYVAKLGSKVLSSVRSAVKTLKTAINITSQAKNSFMNHAFSKKHIKDGLLNLGKSKEQLFKTASRAVTKDILKKRSYSW